MMRQMRQNTKIIMLVTATAFVALMVFEWGMDMSGQTAGGDLGRVGGTRVSVFEWNEARRQLHDRIQSNQTEPITGAQNREIDDLAWEEVVSQILIRHELDRRGIRVSEEEIRQAARFSPPPGVRDNPMFQTEGVYDPALWEGYLREAAFDPDFMSTLEMYYRDIIPRSKLMRQVSTGIYVPEAALWREYRDRNDRIEIRFVAFDADTWIGDDEVSVPAADVDRYYRSNRSDFAVPATARVQYAFISTAASAADSAAALDRALEVREEILAGANFADMARFESTDLGSARLGGDLGRFPRGTMVGPFDDAAFSLPIGEIGEPVQTEYGWHLIEVTDRDDEAGEAEARHILFSYAPTGDREFELLSRADSLEMFGREMPLAEAAARLGLTVHEAEITEDFAFLPEIGNAGEGQDWVFEELEGPGAVSPVFEVPGGFYMFETLEQDGARVLRLEEVRDDIEAMLRTELKVERAKERASALAEDLRGGRVDLDALAAREGATVEEPEAFTRMNFVAGIGMANAPIGAAFGAEAGEIAGPSVVGSRLYLIEVVSKDEADRELFETVREAFRMQLTQQLRQQRLDQWIDGLRETTRVVDRRAQYFRAAEQAADGPGLPFAF